MESRGEEGSLFNWKEASSQIFCKALNDPFNLN